MFGAVLCLTHRLEIVSRHLTKKINFRCACLILLICLIPSILAGVRADSVGTDTAGYGKLIIEECTAANSFSQLNATDLTYTEKGFRLFCYLVSRISKGYFPILFGIEFFIVFCVITALYRMRRELSLTIGMAVFLFCYFHLSLNMMRQMMAMSVLLLAFTFLIEKKYIIYVILAVLAYSLHTASLLIAVLLFVLCKFGKLYNTNKKKSFFVIASVAIFALFQYFIQRVMPLFGGIFYRYYRYFSEDVSTPLISILSSPYFLINLLLFYLSSVILFRNKKLTDNDDVLFMTGLLANVFKATQAYLSISYRIGTYLMFFYIIYVSRTFMFPYIMSKRDRKIILYFLLFVLFVCDCMLSGHSSTAVFKIR